MNNVFEPNWGNPSLRSIVEVAFPEPITFMPATSGWWIVFAVLLGFIFRFMWRRRQHYLADSYRREALAELSLIKERLHSGVLESVRDIAPLLKAAAIEALGREVVSGLQGEDYAGALAALSPNQDHLPVSELHSLAYAPLVDIEHIDLAAVIARVEYWITHHRRQDA